MTDKAIVDYQIATYSGHEIVYCHENDDNEQIIEKCKRQLKQNSGGIGLPFG